MPLRTCVAILVLAFVTVTAGQDLTPAAPLTLVSREGRRPVPTTVQAGREVIALDDVASLFRVTVREDTLAGGVTVSYRGRTIVASANRSMASVDGRIVSLPSPVIKAGNRWLVPLEFLSAALASIYDQRIELRRASRLVVVGDVRLPRVTTNIDFAGPPTRASIQIAPAAAVNVSSETGRMVVRVDADALDFPSATGGGLVQLIRQGDQPNQLVVTLTEAAGTPRATVTTTNNVARVVIDVPAAVAAAAAAPAPDSRPPTADANVPGPESLPPDLDPRASIIASRTWQTIVIDPGHGGDDVGVRGVNGLEEKQLTLDIARRLRAMVENRLGLRVILTREDDRSVGLDDRAAVANNRKANLLISLHVNGSPISEQSGAEIFHLQLDRESADVVRAAAAGGATLPALGGGVRRLDLIPWDLAQARHLDESSVLASVLREELQRQVPMSSRPIRQAPMRLLAAVNMPAALVELAYLTNPRQERGLTTDDLKTTVTQAIFSAIVRFRAWSEGPQTP